LKPKAAALRMVDCAFGRTMYWNSGRKSTPWSPLLRAADVAGEFGDRVEPQLDAAVRQIGANAA
jgi:hypothetical protein